MKILVASLLVVIALAAVVFLVLVGAVAFFAVKYKPPIMGILGMLGGAAYVGSPVDALPEVVLGPVGLLDDVGVIALIVWYMVTLVQRRKG